MASVPAAKIDELKSRFEGQVIQPSNPTYDSARQIWNSMIEPVSRDRAHGVANVWNRVLPTPIATMSVTRSRTPGARAYARRPRRHAAQAARKKARFVVAFRGSAQSPGPRRSQ